MIKHYQPNLNICHCSKKKKEKKEELVIPLITTNRWRHARKPEDLEREEASNDNDTTSTEQQPADEAVREILQGISRSLINHGQFDSILAPLVLKHKT